MLESVKEDMRISHKKLDNTLQMTINAAYDDLRHAGASDDTDMALVARAVCMYCRWMIDFRGKADMWHKFYEEIKACLASEGE